jgi:hypothetical protein
VKALLKTRGFSPPFSWKRHGQGHEKKRIGVTFEETQGVNGKID